MGAVTLMCINYATYRTRKLILIETYFNPETAWPAGILGLIGRLGVVTAPGEITDLTCGLPLMTFVDFCHEQVTIILPP